MRIDPWHVLFSILGAALCFGITECAVGVSRSEDSEVVGKNFIPAYTTTSCHSNGKSTNCTSQYHPPQYLLSVRCSGDVHTIDSHRWWLRLERGDPVRVAHRDGRWTGIHYLHWVDRRLASRDW